MLLLLHHHGAMPSRAAVLRQRLFTLTKKLPVIERVEPGASQRVRLSRTRAVSGLSPQVIAFTKNHLCIIYVPIMADTMAQTQVLFAFFELYLCIRLKTTKAPPHRGDAFEKWYWYYLRVTVAPAASS